MKVYGVQLSEGSDISNMTIDSGIAFPSNPNDAELFYRSDTSSLHLYRNSAWERVTTAGASVIQAGAALPSPAIPSSLFYLASGVTSTEGLYYALDTSTWVLFSSSAQDLQYATDQAIAMAIALG